ncbi:MAG TPA: rubrerythrin family protein [Clostridiales bacterium]|nr:rubrerythrin family protein [Clostridiales bacterium]
MEFKDSRTYLNLQAALENELRTNALYGLYRKHSDQEVLLEISIVFETISRNAQFIGERLRRILNEGDTSTFQNLVDAANTEFYVANSLYSQFSDIATEEGYNDLASLFNGIANIKLHHYSTLQTFVENMENNQLFCKSQENLWICLGCGNILSGECAPQICPICGYPQGYYQIYGCY